ncbi:MAG: amino acid ABC transporter permease [Sporomusaceae bacterium]|nr:amino acid ABC transporter permease [Sporomusaceae bacterium]
MILEIPFMTATFLELLAYVPVTLFLAIASMLLAAAVGLGCAVAQLRRVPLLAPVCRFYLLIGRATPTMVMLYLVYFGLPLLLLAASEKTGIATGYQRIPPMLFAVFALTLHTGAYLAEIFRAALLSVDKGQMEAAHSIGMTWFQGFRRIVLRQAAVFALPLIANQFLGLIKSTSIVFTITVVELLGAAKIASAEHYRYLETYLVVALMYWLISIAFEKAFRLVEKKLSLYKSEVTT